MGSPILGLLASRTIEQITVLCNALSQVLCYRNRSVTSMRLTNGTKKGTCPGQSCLPSLCDSTLHFFPLLPVDSIVFNLTLSLFLITLSLALNRNLILAISDCSTIIYNCMYKFTSYYTVKGFAVY